MPLGVITTNNMVVLVDPQDYDAVATYTWHAVKKGRVWYAKMNNRKLLNGSPSHRLCMHNFLLQRRKTIDHVNGNGLDNTRSNLRPANHSLNAAARKKKPGTSSQYKGVYKYKGNRWRASITVRMKIIPLGVFRCEKQAALAYNEKAKEAFGEFAVLNEV